MTEIENVTDPQGAAGGAGYWPWVVLAFGVLIVVIGGILFSPI